MQPRLSRRAALAAFRRWPPERASLGTPLARAQDRYLDIRPGRRFPSRHHRGDDLRRRSGCRGATVGRHHQRLQAVRLHPADRPVELSRTERQSGAAAARRLAADQRAIRADRPHEPRRRRQDHDRVPVVGYRGQRPSRRPAVFDRSQQRAPRRPHHRRRGLHPRHWREGLLRLACRLRRRDRAAPKTARSAWPSWTRTAST